MPAFETRALEPFGFETRRFYRGARHDDATIDALRTWCTEHGALLFHEQRLRVGDASLCDGAPTMRRRESFDPHARRTMGRTTRLAPLERAVPV